MCQFSQNRWTSIWNFHIMWNVDLFICQGFLLLFFKKKEQVKDLELSKVQNWAKVLWRILGNLRAENSCPQYANCPDWNTFFLLEHLKPQNANHNLQRKIKKLYFQSACHFKTESPLHPFVSLPFHVDVSSIGLESSCRTPTENLSFSPE